MFEAADFDRDRLSLSVSLQGKGFEKKPNQPHQPVLDSKTYESSVRIILETGFKARVMSWRSAYDVGRRNNLSLDALRTRVEQASQLINAGLSYAVDESLFAALVYQYAALARDIANQER